MPVFRFTVKFDAIPLQIEATPLWYDVLPDRINEQLVPGKIDIRAQASECRPILFDSFRIGALPQVLNARFHAAARQVILVRNRLDSLRPDKTGCLLRNRFDAALFQKSRETIRYHAINDFPAGVGRLRFLNDSLLFQHSKVPVRWTAVNDFPVGVGCLVSSYDSLLAVFGKMANRFQVLSDYVARIQSGRFPARFRIDKSASSCLPVRFDVLPQEFLAFLHNRFDSNGRGLTLHPARKQAFVRPGWRIVVKNILTNEILDLGFIDQRADAGPRLPSACEPSTPVGSLTDINLPDGEYEVSVLTSSLFWKDASDFDIRLLTIKSGEEVSSLPAIYNLRSSISQGETTIRWSAGKSDSDDCVFGIWYASTSPVPADGPPTETVWYFSELTEYQTSFQQVAPCYVAIAAMKPGNEPEFGKIHELWLDWKSTPPRAPDDVIIGDSER
jgi:hypothetical protein